ncbi:MAG: M15 family metallopeptidase [Kofleriaceae bacterium]
MITTRPLPAPSPDAAGPPPGWIDVATTIPDAVLDLRYATDRNLTGAPLYRTARCWLREAAAARLAQAAAALRRDGLRLVMWDCYRPPSAQLALWQRVPDRRFVAEPRLDGHGRPIGGSVHSRGGAIDVSLADRAGAPLVMPTDHDDFSGAASGAGATGAARRNLARLRGALTAAGFHPIASEWWHFEAAGTGGAPLVELPD